MNTNSIHRVPNHGFSSDKRKRRRQHRQAVKSLAQQGGSICANVAWWHLQQAKYL